MLKLRAYLFYAGYSVLTVFFSLTGVLLFSLLPFRVRGRYMTGWNWCCLQWLRLTCGVSYRVIGAENLPDTPYVAVSKHQSQWETFFLQAYLFPVCFVLKQELLKIPLFGWGLRLMNPIAIDRANPRQAMRQIQDDGLQRLKDGYSVLIFPEGTRTAPGQVGKYARGGANMAIAAEVPLVPVALNAGECWPADELVKHSGTVTFVIGEPLTTADVDSRALTEQAQQWIEEQMLEINHTARPPEHRGRSDAAGTTAPIWRHSRSPAPTRR